MGRFAIRSGSLGSKGPRLKAAVRPRVLFPAAIEAVEKRRWLVVGIRKDWFYADSVSAAKMQISNPGQGVYCLSICA